MCGDSDPGGVYSANWDSYVKRGVAVKRIRLDTLLLARLNAKFGFGVDESAWDDSGAALAGDPLGNIRVWFPAGILMPRFETVVIQEGYWEVVVQDGDLADIDIDMRYVEPVVAITSSYYAPVTPWEAIFPRPRFADPAPFSFSANTSLFVAAIHDPTDAVSAEYDVWDYGFGVWRFTAIPSGVTLFSGPPSTAIRGLDFLARCPGAGAPSDDVVAAADIDSATGDRTLYLDPDPVYVAGTVLVSCGTAIWNAATAVSEPGLQLFAGSSTDAGERWENYYRMGGAC